MLNPCFTGRLSCCALAACLAIAHAASAGTVTWTGNGDGESWNLPSNWSGSAVPSPTDDVEHHNSDTIQMNIGTSGTPTIIKSFKATGSAGGALVIQGGKGLRVTGDFTNSSTAATDRYELTIGSKGKLDLDSNTGDADLVRVNVTMVAGDGTTTTELVVDGEILDGDYTAAAFCDINVGVPSIESISILSGTWTLSDGTDAVFQDVVRTSEDAPLVLTLESGSSMTILDPEYPGDSFASGQNNELRFGSGVNTLNIGQAGAHYPGLVFSYESFIAPSDNSGSLTINLYGKTAIKSCFLNDWVREGWDCRQVDLVALPMEEDDGSQGGPRFEMISTHQTVYFPADPVIFLDVPCMGAWRDLELTDSTSTTLRPLLLTDEWYTSTSCGTGSTPPETGLFRNITVGEHRTLKVWCASPIYYYGTLTIDSTAIIEDVDSVVTGSAIDDLITPACGTIYGDWDGDCEIITAELDKLRVAVQGGSSTYNPLYDSNCDGVLTAGVERAKAAANYLAQPTCDCGGESMMFGGGGSSQEEIEAVAAWLIETMTGGELAQFIVDLVDAIAEHEGLPIADEMTALLIALGD